MHLTTTRRTPPPLIVVFFPSPLTGLVWRVLPCVLPRVHIQVFLKYFIKLHFLYYSLEYFLGYFLKYFLRFFLQYILEYFLVLHPSAGGLKASQRSLSQRTMLFCNGLLFGTINIVDNFGTVFNDQLHRRSVISMWEGGLLMSGGL